MKTRFVSTSLILLGTAVAILCFQGLRSEANAQTGRGHVALANVFGARAYSTSPLSFFKNVPNPLSFPSITYDDAGFTRAGPGLFIIPMDGLYAVEANLTLNDPFALNAIVWVKLQIIGPSGVIAEASTLSDPNHSNASTLTVSTTMRFNRNDQVSFCLLTDVTSGTSMTENGTDVYHGSIALVGK